MKIMKHVGDKACSSTRDKLFMEGNEDEDKDPCGRRRAYKKVHHESYKHRQATKND